MKNAALRVPLAILLLVPGGCEAATTETPLAQEEIATPREAPTAEDAANATYTGIYEEPITLTEGRYEGEPFVPDGASRPSVGLLDELQSVIDLDGDGTDERIVLLWETSGGSGTSLYVARVRPGGEAVATYVGDRVQVRSLAQVGDLLQMGVLRAGADDARCCPGELATMRWRAAAGGLDLVSDETDGRFGLSTIAGEWGLEVDRDVADRLLAAARREGPGEEGDLRVTLTKETARDLAAAVAEITLTIGADGTVTGRSGCNQYSGAVRFDVPNEIDFGPLRMTLMACDLSLMGAEQEFLSRLQAAKQAGFHMGKLAFGWQTEGAHGTLMFTPR